MRELVWIAGHIEHRKSERKLQVWACLKPTPIWGSLLNLSPFICVNIQMCCECSFTTHFRLNQFNYNSRAYQCESWTIFVKEFCFFKHLAMSECSSFWPQIRREHSLNLSILLSEGKENNNDSLSNGEWIGKSSVLNRSVSGIEWYVAYKFRNGRVNVCLSTFECVFTHSRCEAHINKCYDLKRNLRVELFGNAAQSWW